MKKRVAAMGGYYFFYFAAQACMAGSLNVWLESALGLSSAELGLFNGLGAVAAAAALPWIGVWADRWGRQGWLLTGSLVVLLLCADRLGQQRAFFGVLLWGIGWEIARSAGVALADKSASAQRGAGYGSVRSLGSLGFLFGGGAIAMLTKLWPLEKLLFPLYLLLMGGAAVLSLLWQEKRPPSRSVSMKLGLSLLREGWFRLALTMGALGSVGVSALQPWLGSYLVNTLGAPESALGWNTLFCVAGELVALPLFGKKLIPRWGFGRCFGTTALALALRCALYALSGQVWMVYGASLLYGVSVCGYTAVNLAFVAHHAPEGTRATAVLTIGAVSALGRGAAGWLFGLLSSAWGTRSIFWAVAVAALGAMLALYRSSTSSTGQ